MTRVPAQFYVLNKLGRRGCEMLRTDDAVIGDAPCCKACGGTVDLRAWLPPLRVELLVCRKGYCDILYTTSYDLLISSRFRQIYESERLTGFSGFDPVEIVKVKPKRRAQEPPPAYYRVHVARSQAVVDPEASGWDPPEDTPMCPVCRIPSRRERWKGIVITPSTWSGEDVFRPTSIGQTIVSERFKQICEAYTVTNVCLVPAEEYSWDFYPAETKDWPIRIYDETLAVLRTMNKGGRLDEYVHAMEEMRKYVLTDPKFDWIEELRERFDGRIDPIGDAAHDAQYNLIAPWYGKYVRQGKCHSSGTSQDTGGEAGAIGNEGS